MSRKVFCQQEGGQMKFLSNLRNRLRKTMFNNERGQGMTEYILLLVIIVGIIMVFGKQIKEKINIATGKLGGNIDTVIDTNSNNY